MNKLILSGSVCASALMLAIPMSSNAVPIFGVTTDAATFECLPACTNGNFDDDGGEGFLEADVTQMDTRGLGFAIAELGGGFSLPTLKAYGAGDGPHTAQGSAFGLQAYTYNGAGNKTFTLNISFSGHIISAFENFGDSIIARVGILTDDFIEFESSLPTLVGELGATFVQDTSSSDALAEFSLFNSTFGVTTVNDSISFELAPGDVIYLHTTLSAAAFSGAGSSMGGSLADASQSLTMSFVDGGGLVAAGQATVIPIPPALLLFSTGLLGVIGFARRR